MFVGWTSGIVTDFIANNFSFYHLLCVPEATVGEGITPFCATIFLYSKFFELVDTLFLILRKREVIFLHWYHHTTVLAYTWYCTIVMYPAGNLYGIVNSFVHIIMYSYYFLTSFGFKPWWGKYVTRLQLAQMVVGMISTSGWAYFHYISPKECSLWSPLYGGKHEDIIAISSLILYGSYFALFLHLYLNRFAYSEEGKKKQE